MRSFRRVLRNVRQACGSSLSPWMLISAAPLLPAQLSSVEHPACHLSGQSGPLGIDRVVKGDNWQCPSCQRVHG